MWPARGGGKSVGHRLPGSPPVEATESTFEAPLHRSSPSCAKTRAKRRPSLARPPSVPLAPAFLSCQLCTLRTTRKGDGIDGERCGLEKADELLFQHASSARRVRNFCPRSTVAGPRRKAKNKGPHGGACAQNPQNRKRPSVAQLHIHTVLFDSSRRSTPSEG